MPGKKSPRVIARDSSPLAESRCPLQQPENRSRYLQNVDPMQFERIVHELFSRLGWRVTPTKCSGDGGIDGLLQKGRELWVLQCKRYADSNKVGSPVLRDLLGATVGEGASLGVLVTTSTFTDDALKWAEGKQLKLISGAELLKMLEQAFPSESQVPASWLTERKCEVTIKCPLCKSETRINVLTETAVSCPNCDSANSSHILRLFPTFKVPIQ